jgi:hypothetical protein
MAIKAEVKEAQEKIRQLAENGKKDFYFFMRYILGSQPGFSLIEEVPHKEMCDLAQRWKKNKKIILTPRDTFKTTIFVVGYSLWRIVNDPQIAILITADKQATSIQSLAAIKEVIESHDIFKACYGDLKSEINWAANQIKVSTRKGTGKRAPTIMCSGVDSPKVSFHFDLILFDDPHNEKNISTPEQIMKVIKYYISLHPLLDSVTGQMQITATRWHHQDIHNYILTEEKNEWDIFIRAAEWEEDGEKKYFYPARLTPEFLAKRKAISTYFFSCQYLNNPTDDENALFKKNQINNFTFDGKFIFVKEANGLDYLKINRSDLAYYVSVDPSGRGSLSEQRRLDYTGIVVVGVDYRNNWYVFEAMRKRGMQPSEIIEKLIELHYSYKPEVIGIEAITYQGQIKEGLQREFDKRRIFQPVRDLQHHNRDKGQRIRGLQPLYKDGKIYHVKGLFDLELELLSWSPNSTVHDDVIDALAYVKDIAVMPDETEVKVVENIAAAHNPGVMIAADLEWTKSGRCGSFSEFLETFSLSEIEAEEQSEDKELLETIAAINAR